MIKPVYTSLNSYYLIALFIAIIILFYKHFYQDKQWDKDPMLSVIKEVEMTDIKKGGTKYSKVKKYIKSKSY